MLSEAMSKTEKKSRSARKRRWSANVTKHSDALDLEQDVFKSKDPRKIARSLKHSAEQSNRREGTPYQSAMSMLNNDALSARSRSSLLKQSIHQQSAFPANRSGEETRFS